MQAAPSGPVITRFRAEMSEMGYDALQLGRIAAFQNELIESLA